MYVFMGAIASGMVYMSVRSFVRTAFEMFEEHDCFSERTDHLEANQIAISMFEAYFSPFFATILMKYDPGYVVPKSISFLVDIFFWGQVVQTFGFLFWNFVVPFKFRGLPWRNRIVPVILRVIVQVIFIVIPAGKTMLYLYYVYRTDLLDTPAGPWLLMCTVNCIFILLVWY